MKRFFLSLSVLFIIITAIFLGYKMIGTSYCYIKTPENKQEANQVIDFCSKDNLFFDENYSQSLANIFKKYPDNLQNEKSASVLITHYIKTNPIKNLDKIEKLTNIITDDTYKQEKRFLFILEGGYFEENLPFYFRRKTFNTIYEKYKNILTNDKNTEKSIKKITLEDMEFLHNKLNQ